MLKNSGLLSVDAMPEKVLELENVCLQLNSDSIIENLTWSVRDGEFWGLIGPNGGGKTTLLKGILGLIRPSKGTIRLFGTDISEFSDWSKVGYVPQKFSFFDQNFPASVREVVSMGRFAKLGFFRRPGPVDEKMVNEALSSVDMLQYRDRQIGSLSLGQQQRVFIARALASEPRLLILDEPMSGIDTVAERMFFALLGMLNRKKGITVIMVSHDIGAVASHATKVACINRNIFFQTKPKALLTGRGLLKIYRYDINLVLHGTKH